MAGLRAVIVGYRHNDRRRLRLAGETGLQSVPIRKCVAGCGFPVYFVPSGQTAFRERDPEVICTECYELHKDQVQAEL